MRKYLGVCFVLLFSICTIVAVAIWQGLYSFLFAWVLNFMLMMVTLSITQATMPKLASSYYNSRDWEGDGKIYKWFGVQAFRKLLVLIGWEKLNKAANPVKKNLDALKHLEYATRQSEFGHLVIFFIVLAFALFVAIYYGAIKSLWLIILNVILHVYPILVQRYNRPRLQKAIKKLKTKK